MNGRPPKPTAIKALEGNRGKRRLNDAEPDPPSGVMVPPKAIAARADYVEEWNRLAVDLAAWGILKRSDRDVLAAYVVVWVRFLEEVEANLPTEALIGTVRELRQLWARFGMTPADRSRIRATKPEAVSKLEQFRRKSAS